MLIYAVLGTRKVSWLALTCAIAPVLGACSGRADWTQDKIGTWYQSACVVERLLKDAQKQLKAVGEWREIESAAEHARAQGEFLRVGDPIPVNKPKSAVEALSELYSMSRSARVHMTLATQHLSSTKEVLG
jgi:hypothetical protein